MKISWSRLGLGLTLFLLPLIWGSTFLVVQDSIHYIGTFSFLTLRFGIAAIVLACIYYKALRKITRLEILSGFLIGIFIFAAYALQTLGLQYTTSSKSGFITALYAPMVPLFSILFLRQKPRRGATIGVVFSFVGLCLIAFKNDFSLEFGLGELLTLLCAVTSALNIIAVSKYAPQVNETNLAIVQIATTAFLSALTIPFFHESLVIPSRELWGAILFMAIIATAFCILAMNRVQKILTSVQATLIYALEPMWAALFGYLASERLSIPAWIGCTLMLLGMFAGMLDSRKKNTTITPVLEPQSDVEAAQV